MSSITCNAPQKQRQKSQQRYCQHPANGGMNELSITGKHTAKMAPRKASEQRGMNELNYLQCSSKKEAETSSQHPANGGI
jgi:hypothetical protein